MTGQIRDSVKSGSIETDGKKGHTLGEQRFLPQKENLKDVIDERKWATGLLFQKQTQVWPNEGKAEQQRKGFQR